MTADDRWLAEMARLREAHPDKPTVLRSADRYLLVGQDGATLRGDDGIALEFATPEGATSALRGAVKKRGLALAAEVAAILAGPWSEERALRLGQVDRDICACRAALDDDTPAPPTVAPRGLPSVLAGWGSGVAEALGLTPEEMADPALDAVAPVDVEGHLRWLATGEGEPFPPAKDGAP